MLVLLNGTCIASLSIFLFVYGVLIAVVVMCGPDEFIYHFVRDASSRERDVDNGASSEYMYLSIRTVHYDVLHPWSIREGYNPSEATLKAFRNLMQVMRTKSTVISVNKNLRERGQNSASVIV